LICKAVNVTEKPKNWIIRVKVFADSTFKACKNEKGGVYCPSQKRDLNGIQEAVDNSAIAV
jgi:hypothetical protein